MGSSFWNLEGGSPGATGPLSGGTRDPRSLHKPPVFFYLLTSHLIIPRVSMPRSRRQWPSFRLRDFCELAQAILAGTPGCIFPRERSVSLCALCRSSKLFCMSMLAKLPVWHGSCLYGCSAAVTVEFCRHARR